MASRSLGRRTTGLFRERCKTFRPWKECNRPRTCRLRSRIVRFVRSQGVRRQQLTFASALLASNVPNARDGVAVLTLTKGGATTTVVEVGEGIDTFIITTDQTGDRASRETLRAWSNIAGAEFALLGSNALVVITAAVSIVIVVVVVTFTTLAILVIIAGGLGRSGGFGGSGTGWGRVAAKGAGDPIPAFTALRRRKGIGWLVRSTAALSRVPRPVEGAVSVGRWVGGVPRSASGKTDVLGVPPEVGSAHHPPRQRRENVLELVVSTPVGENEGNSQNQEDNASNERHLERER